MAGSISRIGIAFVVLLASVGRSARGQATPTDAVSSAEPTITRWLNLVWRGSAEEAWTESSSWFKGRIGQQEWARWVGAQRGKSPSLDGRARVVGTNYFRDEAPLPVVEWVDMTFVTDLPTGGRFFQRVWVGRPEGETGWYVANYGVSLDSQAMVANAAVDPIPYLGFLGDHRFFGRFVRPRPSSPLPAPEPSRAVANPATFPRRP